MLWGRQPPWAAVNCNTLEVAVRSFERWQRSGLQVEINIISHEQVQQPVAVVVDKRTPGAETGIRMQQTSLGRHICESAIAVVAVELVLPIVGNEEVFKAVVVKVPNADPGAPARIRQARLRRNVFESSVAIVVIQAIARPGRNGIEPAPAHDEDVHPTIVVVIEKGASASHRFDDVFHIGRTAVWHRLGEACGLCHIGEL